MNTFRPHGDGSARVPDRDDALPVDSDIDVDASRGIRPRPVHLRWVYLGLVTAGGVLGTAAREAVGLVIPRVADVPIGTVIVNVVGAFMLGVLLESLVRRGPDEGTRRTLRLLFGTGALGGFTTYSALALDTGVLLTSGHGLAGVVYALATVMVGAAATFGGIAISATAHRHRTAALEAAGLSG